MSKEHYPSATLDLLPEAGQPDGHRKTQVIVHSTGTKASAAANRRYFGNGSVAVESTFIVDYDGLCLQVMWASDKADANASASVRAISIEVVGTGDEPFTPEQVARIIDICRWANADHAVPLARIPEHDKPGVGWHVMFGAPGPWTKVRGKVCPGAKRIQQMVDVILPALAGEAPDVQEDDMPLTDADLDALADRVWQRSQDFAVGKLPPRNLLNDTRDDAGATRNLLKALPEAVKAAVREVGVADVDEDALAAAVLRLVLQQAGT